jgi:uncharacterized membrane protein (DUF2068 family)
MRKKEELLVEHNYPIIVYELITGVFEGLLGVGLLIFGEQLMGLYQELLSQGWLDGDHEVMNLFFNYVISLLLFHSVYIGLYLTIFAAVKLLSAYGLYKRQLWGRHLLVGLMAVLIPLDFIGLVTHFTLFKLSFLLINIAIVLVLVNEHVKKTRK